uniref:Uncharacterized protein n=1 Tax=Arundo donax TaxID=35708 RepID=A0A0A9FP12_ARUDO
MSAFKIGNITNEVKFIEYPLQNLI